MKGRLKAALLGATTREYEKRAGLCRPFLFIAFEVHNLVRRVSGPAFNP